MKDLKVKKNGEMVPLRTLYNPERHKQFNAALSDAYDACVQMIDLWHEDFHGGEYPFDFSFDEITGMLMRMRQDIREVIVKVGKAGKVAYMSFTGVTEDGFLQCHPRGGGFAYKVPASEVLDFDCEVPQVYRKVRVFAGDESYGTYEAWVDDLDRWNGWLQPMMQMDEVERFVAEHERLVEEHGINAFQDLYRIHDGRLQHKYDDGEWEDCSQFFMVDADDGKKTVLDMGLGLTWEEWTLREGDRIELTSDVERYPHFVVPKGSKGTVECIEETEHVEGLKERFVSIKMDDKIENCEEWNNCIVWNGDEGPGCEPEMYCKPAGGA